MTRFGCRAASAARSIGVDFAGIVAGGLDPGVLKDDRLQFGGAAHERIGLGTVTPSRHPELEADHRSVTHAAVDLTQAGFNMLGIDVNEAEGPVVPVTQGLQDLVVLRRSSSGVGSTTVRVPM